MAIPSYTTIEGLRDLLSLPDAFDVALTTAAEAGGALIEKFAPDAPDPVKLAALVLFVEPLAIQNSSEEPPRMSAGHFRLSGAQAMLATYRGPGARKLCRA